MLEPSGADIDPAVFEKDNHGSFEAAIGFAVNDLERSGEVIRLHDGFDSEAATDHMVEKLEEEGGEITEAYQRLVGSAGSDFMKGIVGKVTGISEQAVSEEDYQEALEQREQAGVTLIDHTVGYYNFMHSNLVDAYEEDSDHVEEEAWTATWKKLKDTLKGLPGTLLAEMAGFFDEVARAEFGPAFRRMEEDRGPAVQANICARTFYAVMQDHVPRAIIGANRDEWTGYQ